jgi:arylsulfatase A-like enzyme
MSLPTAPRVGYNGGMNAICLVFDRLHAGYVGAYGNSWIDTPALDRMASQAFVLDQALIDSPDLERLYRSYWQGWHAMCPAPPANRPTLLAMLREAGITTALLTDERQVARHPLAVDFDELIEIDPPWQPQAAEEIHQTHFGRCFAQVIEWLESARGPFLLWCHLGGLGTTWDAPLRFRRAYRDQGDPPPPEGAEVPERTLPADYHPDELLGVTQAYSGQVTLLDACLGALGDFLDALPTSEETLLTLTSARGFPLGEHGRVGPCDGALFGELVHVPWMIQLPDATGAAMRSQALVEPADLWATLLDWWGLSRSPLPTNLRSVPGEGQGVSLDLSPLPSGEGQGVRAASPTAESLLRLVRGEAGAYRDRLCVAGAGPERAIRTPAWYLRAGIDPELFAKPDDRWEINNVASRCRDVVECLLDALARYESTLPAGRISDLPPLGNILVSGLE